MLASYRLRVIVWIVCCGFLSALTGNPSVGFAQDGAPACSEIGEAAFKNYQNLEVQGVEAFKANDYATAIKRFETAKTLCDKSQSLIFALGRAHHLANHCDQAIDHYKKALQLTGPKLESISKRLTEVEEECAKRPGELSVICEQAGVMLSVNGEPTVACPLKKPMPAGLAVVSAEKTDFEPFKADATIKPGETATVRVPTLKAVEKKVDDPIVPPPPPDNTLDIVGWSLMGGGALLLGGGIGMLVWSSGLQDDFKAAQDSADGNNVVQNGLSRPDALALEADATTGSIMGWTLTGFGTALIATGAVLWALPNAETPVTIAPSAGSDYMQLTICGQF